MAKGKKPAFRIERVPLAKIERGGGTQARVGINEDTVTDYVEALKAGKQLPPPVVFKDGDGVLRLGDGYHRVEAHARNKARGIDVELHVGGQREAILYAAGANAFHGLRRTPDDKQRAVRMLLADPEWASWSDRAIAEHCHVSHPFVAKTRASTGSASSQRVGADGRTIETAAIGEANRERAVVRQSAATAGMFTPDAAPAHKPRVVREGAQEEYESDEPEYQQEEGEGGDLVEDGAMADPETYGNGPAGEMTGLVEDANEGLRDNDGTPVPGDLADVWLLLYDGAAEVDRALNVAAHAWARLQDQLLRHVRKVGSDAHLPSRFMPSVDNDFGPSGRIHSMQSLLRRMVPHVLCGNCEGMGCSRCDSLGWFSRIDWKERQRVDGVLKDVGAGE